MQAPLSLHPSDQTLRAFGNGELDAALVETISRHLDDCQACLQKVAAISSDSFLDAFRKARSTESPAPRRIEPDRVKSQAAARPDLPCAGPTASATRASMADCVPPELANHPDYEIRRELGRGGMGVVYLAHNRLMGRDEVLKVMERQIIERPGVMDRFLREIRAVARLRHPNIVAAYTAFRSSESLVFAMEYVEGLDLARMIKARGPMPVGNACSYIQQAALGLQHAHEKGMVHRDIKPGNLMLSRDGDRALIKVLDFGLAKASLENKVVELGVDREKHAQRSAADLTSVGQMLGTPDFIAPEQIDDALHADIRADIYSLGCTLYYLLSGGPPFRAATLYDILQAHHSMDAQMLNFVRPEVPTELAALVAKMMAKEPERRFQTPDEVAKALPPFFKRRAQTAVAPDFGFSQVAAPATSLSTAGSTQVAAASAPAPAPVATTVATRNQNRPEEMWKSLSDFKEAKDNQPAPARNVVYFPAVATQTMRKVAGLVGFFAILLGAGIAYRVFLYDPSAVEVTPDEPVISSGPTQPKRDLETEARSMFNRARDTAQAGRTKEAIALLENVTKVYRGAKTAVEAKEALARPDQNLPLFLDRPAVKPETAPQPTPEPRPAPPQVVVAQPKQTQASATLVLPANPAEPRPARPSPLAMATTPDGRTKIAQAHRALPPGFSAKAEAGVHSSGWPLAIVGKRDGGTMVFVPGGTFTMGNDGGPPAEVPAHKVRLSSYYIDQHEVTVRQFGLFLKETHYRGQPAHNWSEDSKQITSDSAPMVMVNARDAQAYTEWASKQLPTEAQWEMAARATDGRLFPSGPEPIKYSKPRAARQAEPVMSYPEDVSPYGAYDMAGNVWEWTKDWYDSKYYRQLFGQATDNPTGPSSKPRSVQLVVKGGAKNGSASFREGMALDKRLSYIGFRCVLPVQEQASLINPAPGAPAPSQPAPAPGPGQSANPPAGQNQSVPVPF